MRAALVQSFHSPPEYATHLEPTPEAHEELITVTAAAASPLVRAIASGTHYASPKELPFIPGVDGVGTTRDGRRVYFAFPRAPFGSLAQRTVVDKRFCVTIPDGLHDVSAAALANPGMSSWAALTERAHLQRGETVLVNGATGASGRLAIRIARHLGAARIIATGRDEAALESLGADATISLRQTPDQLITAFKQHLPQTNVVLDYLWGSSAEALINAASGHGSQQAEPRIRFVQIGAISGGNISLPAGALRSSGLELMGSGLGSVSHERLVAGIGAMLVIASQAGLGILTRTAPLDQVTQAWPEDTPARLVLTIDPTP